MDRHFTVSGFVVHEGRVALHWHRKLGMWLPAGGHVEPNEDPVQAVLREVAEEFAIESEVMRLAPQLGSNGGPSQIEPPFTVQNCVIEPGHEHVDFVYFLHLLSGYPGRSHDSENPIVWLTVEELEGGSAETHGMSVAFPPDVQALGIEAIHLAAAQPVRT
jgi:8-oxo-dGTP pyrophosphatase MutT (NUDIX family)